MGLKDFKEGTKNTVQIYAAGTEKYKWLETLLEFLQFIIVLLLCFKAGWTIPAILMIIVFACMIIVTVLPK